MRNFQKSQSAESRRFKNRRKRGKPFVHRAKNKFSCAEYGDGRGYSYVSAKL